MSNRISEEDLEDCCEELNELFGYALETYTKAPENIEGISGYKPNPNVFHIDMAYGGYSLSQMSSSKGCTGVSDVPAVYGRFTKRELYVRMCAYISGIRAAKDL